MLSSRYRRETLIKILLVVIIIAACIPFFLSVRYAIFHGDDFSTCLGVRKAAGDTHFIRAVNETINMYMTWNGPYTSFFAEHLINPMLSYSYSMLRLMLIALLASAFLMCYLLSREINHYFKLGSSGIYIFASLLLPVLLFRDYNETYLGFVGAMAYELPFVLMLAAMALGLRAKRKNSVLLTVLSCILFFLMAGGVLLIGGFAASVLLTFMIAEYVHERRPNMKTLAFFLTVLVGDLINAMAPGNFVKSGMSGELDIVGAFTGSFVSAANEIVFFLTNITFWLFLALMFCVGTRAKQRPKKIIYIGSCLGLLLATVVTAFPMLLGYHGDDINAFSNRGLFALDVSVIVALESMAFSLGAWFNSRGLSIKSRRAKLGIAATLSAIMIVSIARVPGYIPTQIARNYADGKIQAYAGDWWDKYEYLRQSPGEDVVFWEFMEPCTGVLEMFFAADPENNVNRTIAEYFGNNSICTGYYLESQK